MKSPGERKSDILELIDEYLDKQTLLDVMWHYFSLMELEDLLDYLVRYEYIPEEAAYPDEEDIEILSLFRMYGGDAGW